MKIFSAVKFTLKALLRPSFFMLFLCVPVLLAAVSVIAPSVSPEQPDHFSWLCLNWLTVVMVYFFAVNQTLHIFNSAYIRGSKLYRPVMLVGMPVTALILAVFLQTLLTLIHTLVGYGADSAASLLLVTSTAHLPGMLMLVLPLKAKSICFIICVMLYGFLNGIVYGLFEKSHQINFTVSLASSDPVLAASIFAAVMILASFVLCFALSRVFYRRRCAPAMNFRRA